MQLPDEKNLTSPVTNGAALPNFPQFDRSLFADNPFLSRSENPPTFFQMLALLSDSPVHRPDRQVDVLAAATISIDSTMDGRDAPIPSSAAVLLAPVTAEVATGATERLITRRCRPQRCKFRFSVHQIAMINNLFPANLTDNTSPDIAPPNPTAQFLIREGFMAQLQVVPGSATSPGYDDTFPPSTPAGTSTNPIWINSRSPRKKRNFSAATNINKAKKRCRPLSPVAILPLPDCRQRGRYQTPSTGPWPTTVISDSEEEESIRAFLQDPTPTVPTPMTSLSVVTPSVDPSQPIRGRGRRARRTRRTAAPASPRFTSPPDDMYLPNTPPAGESVAAATPSVTAPSASAPASASAIQRDQSPDDMFLSDSSEELPTSIIPPMSAHDHSTQGTFANQTLHSTSNIASTSNTASTSGLPTINGSPFFSPRTPKGIPLPSPFAHLTPSQFDKFIMKQLGKDSKKSAPP